MPSSLEIAQQATLRPITEIAEAAGLLPDEIDPYGKYKAKVSLDVLDRLADRPDGKLINKATGQTETSVTNGDVVGYEVGYPPAVMSLDSEDFHGHAQDEWFFGRVNLMDGAERNAACIERR